LTVPEPERCSNAPTVRVCHAILRDPIRRNPAGPPDFWIIEMTKLYVGNLPFNATEDSVRAIFAEHGAVEKIALVNDRETGRPRGFGFVEMTSSDAARAMQALDGRDFGGRPLKVNEAQDRPRSGGGGYGRR
jgi:RNA recognition motif-containing protein